MTTQTIKPSILDKLSPGNTKAAQTSAAKKGKKESIAGANPAAAVAGQGAGDAKSPAGSFVDTLKKKIAHKQVQQGGAEESHNTGDLVLTEQLEAGGPDGLILGQDQPLGEQLKPGTDKPAKQVKGPGPQLAAEAQGEEGSDAPQNVAQALGQAQVETQSQEGVVPNTYDVPKAEDGKSGLVSPESVTSAQGLKVIGASPTPGAQQSRASHPDVNSSAALSRPTSEQPRLVPPFAQTTIRADNTTTVSGPSQGQDVSAAGLGQGVKETIGPDSNLPITGFKPIQHTLSDSAQGSESDPKAPIGAEKGVPQLPASHLVDHQAGSGMEQKPQQQTNSQVQPIVKGKPLPDAGTVSQEKALDQESPTASTASTASAASAAQTRQAIPDAIPQRKLGLPRVSKNAARSAPAKSVSTPQVTGIAMPRVATPMASNEVNATNSVDPVIPGNIQVSTGASDLSNPADVKSASQFSGVAVPKDTGSSVSGQILESIHSSLQQGQNRVTIALNPPELGRVSVRFEEQDNQVIGVLEVSQKQTRAEIEQALPQLLQGLQESGVQLKRLDVMLNDQPDQGQPKDQSWNNSSGPHSEQQERQGEEGRSGRTNDYDRSSSEGNWADSFEADESMLVGDTAINMLA